MMRVLPVSGERLKQLKSSFAKAVQMMSTRHLLPCSRFCRTAVFCVGSKSDQDVAVVVAVHLNYVAGTCVSDTHDVFVQRT